MQSGESGAPPSSDYARFVHVDRFLIDNARRVAMIWSGMVFQFRMCVEGPLPHIRCRVAARPWCVTLFVLLLSALAGCGRSEVAGTDDADRPGDEMRLVSLSPAISRTLIDLHLDAHLVGRTPYCDAVDQSIPVVGDLHDLNMELLVRVRPTHVLLQPPAGGVNPALIRIADERDWMLGSWHLDSVDDVRRIIAELPQVIDEGRAEAPPGVADRAETLLAQIDEALTTQAGVFRGSVLLVFGLDPVTAFGEGTYLHEVLTALGGTNAVSHQGYPQFSLEDITRMEPEAVLLVAPRPRGADVEDRPARERLGAIGRLDIPAVHNGRLAVLEHPDGLLPSSGIIGVAKAMNRLLHTMQTARSAQKGRRSAETP